MGEKRCHACCAVHARELKRAHRKIAVLRKKPGYIFFVFHGVQRAGGIHHPSTGPHQPRRCRQNFPLTLGAAGWCLGRPFLPGFWMPPEHTFPRARSIHQHSVKVRRPLCRQLVRIGRYRQRIGNTHALQISGKHSRALGYRLIAHQQAFPAQVRRNLRGLSPRGSA